MTDIGIQCITHSTQLPAINIQFVDDKLYKDCVTDAQGRCQCCGYEVFLLIGNMQHILLSCNAVFCHPYSDSSYDFVFQTRS